MTKNTIYALSTVFGKSGVAVIRISGEDVLSVISQITELNIHTLKPRYAYFTNIINPKTKEVIVKSNEMITPAQAKAIVDCGITAVDEVEFLQKIF